MLTPNIVTKFVAVILLWRTGYVRELPYGWNVDSDCSIYMQVLSTAGKSLAKPTIKKTPPAFCTYGRKVRRMARDRHREVAKWKEKCPRKYELYKQFLRESAQRYKVAKARGADMDEFWKSETRPRDEFMTKTRELE